MHRQSRALKLGFFIHSLSSGGAERVTTNLANYWANKGWDISIVTWTNVEKDFYKLDDRIKRVAINLASESANPLAAIVANLRRIVVLRRILKRMQLDIAVSMMTTTNVLLALAASGLPVKTIGSERSYPPEMPIGLFWGGGRKYAYKHLSAIVALSGKARDWLSQNTHAERIKVIPNAASWPLSRYKPEVLPKNVLNENKKNLIAVGRLSEEKQINIIIECFAALENTMSDWDLVIIGDGPERIALENLICRLGLAERIKLPGRVGNICDWYETANLYVMSSRFEGFPNTLAEAMAYGLAAVSFDCDTGPRDIIRHETDGLLVENGDVEALTQALQLLMSDHALRQKFATRAVEARQRFSIEKVAGMWEQLFKEVKCE